MAFIKTTPFVGRRRELDELARLLDEAAAGHGALVFVSGEAGIGKTRLVEELEAQGRRRGMLPLPGHCHEAEGGPPYIPFVEVLEGAFRTVPEPALRDAVRDAGPELAKLTPDVRRQLPELPGPVELPPGQERRYLFSCVRDFLERLAGRQPIVLVLEDLQWADEPSLLLLEHIAHGISATPILIIGTHRDVALDVSHPLAKVLESLLRHRLVNQVALKALSEEDVAGMLRGMGGHSPPVKLVQFIHSETEGNPFFVEEVCKHLAEEGDLFDARGGWQEDVSTDVSVPASIRLVVGLRLARLSGPVRQTLAAASVIGHTFSSEVLAALGAGEPDGLVDFLAEAERARLVVAAPHGPGRRFAFAHELIRQTLIEDLSHAQRQRLHARVAESIEKLYAGSLEAHASELAYQLYQAGSAADSRKCVHYLELAGHRALAATAYEEASTHFSKALQVLETMEPVEEARHGEILLLLADGDWRAGRLTRCEQSLFRAVDVAKKLGSGDLLARAAAAMAQGWGWTDSQRLIGLLEEAIEAIGGKDHALRARLLARLARELLVRDVLRVGEDVDAQARAVAMSSEAVVVARAAGDPRALALALEARSLATWSPENTEERLKAANEIVLLGAESGDWALASMGREQRIAACMELGEVGQAESDVAEMAQFAEKTKEPMALAAALVYKIDQALRTGRLSEAERLLAEIMTVASGGLRPLEGGRLIFAAQVFLLRREQGRSAELEAPGATNVERYPAVSLRAALSAIYADLGREDEARRHFEQLAANGFHDIPRDPLWFFAVALLAEVSAFLADMGRARALYGLLEPCFTRYVNFNWGQGFMGSAAHYLGLLAGTTRRWNEAESYFERALEMERHAAALPRIAHTQFEFARMLLSRRGPGDRKKAFVLLDEALATSRELGMKRLLRKTEALIESRGVTSPAYPGGLTQREVQVLRLVAAGKSSREIGEELYLSTRTVERHITNVYLKIGAHSRAQATAYALARRLVIPPNT